MSGLSKNKITRIIKAADAWRKKHLFAINAFAPVYFFMFTLGRVYTETAVLAATPFFSYYTACHHILWFACTFLSIVLVIHLVAGREVKDLLILAYGVTLTGLPLLHAIIAGQNLGLTYLRGSFWEILTHAVSFVWTYEADRALTGELIIIFLGVTGLGYFLSKSVKRALFAGFLSYASLMVWAVHWVGKQPHKYAVFDVNTCLVSNCLTAVVFVHILTFMVFFAVWRAGLFAKSNHVWLFAAMAGALAWAAFGFLVWRSGWFVLRFDVLALGLPVFTDIFLLTAFLLRKKTGLSNIGLAVFALLFAVQLAVIGPLLFKAEQGLITPGERANRAKRLEITTQVEPDCLTLDGLAFSELQ